MKRFLLSTSLILAAAGTTVFLIAADPQPRDYPVEAGPAQFLRDHDKAMAESKKTGKPVFAFFQEVPG